MEHLRLLRGAYLDALRLGSGRAADQVVEAALDRHFTAGQLYLDVFQPVAYEIGRMWQVNMVSVAQEHLATAIIEREMGELHPLFKPHVERRGTLLLGCVDQEPHRVGSQMVTDFFEQAGWTVAYLGASVPTETFIAMARETQADLLGLSAQMVYHLPTITTFVNALSSYGLDGIPVMVGGRPFMQQPALYTALGVSFSARDAADAVRQATALFPVEGEV